MNVHYLNVFLGAGAIGIQVFSLAALAVLFLGPKKNKYLDFIDKHYLHLGFIVSFLASLFSLVYSEVINYVPCYLCWFQRIFMFPLPFIFGVAIWTHDRKIVKYTLPLVLVGMLIAAYQSFIYYFGNTANIPCDASGVSCYQELVSVFGGYISVPTLSLSGFFGLFAILLVAHFYKKED